MRSIIILSLVLVGTALGFRSPRTALNQLMSVLYSDGFDKNIAPNFEDNDALDIGVTAHFFGFEFDEKTKKFHSNMYLRQQFVDQRLNDRSRAVELVSGQHLFDKIWTPDTFISTAISVESFNDPKPNMFVKISPNGTVFVSHKLRVVVPCTHNKSRAVYECYIKIESYGYDAKVLKYHLPKGTDKSVSVDPPNDEDSYYKLKSMTAIKNNGKFSGKEYPSIDIKFSYEEPSANANTVFSG